MSKYTDEPRLSIVIERDKFNELNDLLGGWRIKNALFAKITYDLIDVLKKLTPEQRINLIVSIVESDIPIEKYNQSIRKVVNK